MAIPRIPVHPTGLDPFGPRHAFWGLFAIAAIAFIVDAVMSFLAIGSVPGALEQNPIATEAIRSGLPIAVGFKVVVLAQVAVTAHVLSRLDAAWAARLLFAVVAVVGAWGIGTAATLLLAS